MLKKFINLISQPKLIKQLLSMGTAGYLKEIGWIESFKKQSPVDSNGNPLPWVTYCFIDFISNRLDKNMDIFEYGSGNSTLWYAEKVNSVTSVEHNKIWYEKIKKNAPKNVTIYYQELIYNGEYSKFVNKTNRKFDIIIIIDGRDRVNCIKNAINNLKESGIIILDDSERKQYKEGIDFLLNKEFKKIDFWGISPGLVYKKCTTIFYKPKNCLDI
jgi:precorrin-6B methylase 2